jgi:hypothetical protein
VALKGRLSRSEEKIARLSSAVESLRAALESREPQFGEGE